MSSADLKLVPAARKFSTTWFAQNTQSLWEKYILRHRKEIHRYLEIGVCEGQSLLWMLDNVLEGNDFAIAVDPFLPHKRGMEADAEMHLANFRHNMRGYDNRYFHIERRSFDYLTELHVAKAAGFSPLDVIYVDGAHDAKSATEDMVLAFGLLRRGGWMIIDDVNRRYGHGRASVREAAVGFTESYVNLFEWVYREPRQWAIRRRR